ncbi:hypothetical protein HKX48_008071 [Thoreauomyces humboldtii]|nr:hypothetical protein HKX48_008071 [Thoreauomyces humboldtii]
MSAYTAALPPAPPLPGSSSPHQDEEHHRQPLRQQQDDEDITLSERQQLLKIEIAHQLQHPRITGAHLGDGVTPSVPPVNGFASGQEQSQQQQQQQFAANKTDDGNGSSGGSGGENNYDDRDAAGGKAPSRVTARRAQQNREAQRNFRERRKNYIKELEVKVQNLISKDSVLQKTEQQCRDFQMIVDRLSAERDVWVRERELWWREREEIYRAVEALRMEVRQSQTENRRLREMAWTLWNDVGGRSGAPAGAPNGASDLVGSTTEKEGESGDPSKSDSETVVNEPMDGIVTIIKTGESEDQVDAALQTATPGFPGEISLLTGGATSLQPRTTSAPSSPTDIAHDLLALSRAGSPTLRASHAPVVEVVPGDPAAAASANAALEDLKTRMSFWDAERENLYRAASDRERELLLSSLVSNDASVKPFMIAILISTFNDSTPLQIPNNAAASASTNASSNSVLGAQQQSQEQSQQQPNLAAAHMFARVAAELWPNQQQQQQQQPASHPQPQGSSPTTPHDLQAVHDSLQQQQPAREAGAKGGATSGSATPGERLGEQRSSPPFPSPPLPSHQQAQPMSS